LRAIKNAIDDGELSDFLRYVFYKMFYWPCVIVYQCNETKRCTFYSVT
jgi:hypothetical protein